MAKLSYTVETGVEPERILAAATEFSERRLELWPGIDPNVYRLHASGEGWAEVTEGTAGPGIWARERYEWTGNVVRATIQDSNAYRPGGTWELRVEPRPAGGSTLHVSVHRRSHGVKGRLIGAMVQLLGRRILPKGLANTLAVLERESRGPA
jgi:hypothetical protein